MQRRSLFQALFVTGAGLMALPAMAKDRREWPPSDRHDHRRAEPPMSHRRDDFRYYNARGDEFRRGRHLPPSLRHFNYVVADYRRHGLPPPGRHHQWVQVGPDFVLVVATTGVILSVVYGR